MWAWDVGNKGKDRWKFPSPMKHRGMWLWLYFFVIYNLFTQIYVNVKCVHVICDWSFWSSLLKHRSKTQITNNKVQNWAGWKQYSVWLKINQGRIPPYSEILKIYFAYLFEPLCYFLAAKLSAVSKNYWDRMPIPIKLTNSHVPVPKHQWPQSSLEVWRMLQSVCFWCLHHDRKFWHHDNFWSSHHITLSMKNTLTTQGPPWSPSPAFPLKWYTHLVWSDICCFTWNGTISMIEILLHWPSWLEVAQMGI